MPIRKEMQQRYPKDWALRSRFVRFYRARNSDGNPDSLQAAVFLATIVDVTVGS